MEKYSDLYYKLIQEMEELEVEAKDPIHKISGYHSSKAEGMMYVLNRLDRIIQGK